MLRFYNTDFKEREYVQVSQKPLIIGSDMWKECRDFAKECDNYYDEMIHVIPIINSEGKLVAYGYQDNEADRELRMLYELTLCGDALQFDDIFPEYKEVVIYGCNELAVSFAGYLRGLGIDVTLIGKYWDYFGYAVDCEADLDGEDKLVIFAEGLEPKNGSLESSIRKSVSPEFECINEIYETNVLNKKICDTIGSFEDLLQRLDGESEIVILGDGRESQDAYDLLLGHGIDICGFAVEKKKRTMLLGKDVMDIAEAVKGLNMPVFIECHSRNGALGEEYTEYFDYRGYKRNESFFLLRDYTDIPVSNLVHVLHGKSVVLAGDDRLCGLLSEYLYKAENGGISIKCKRFDQSVDLKKDDLLCIVMPDYYNRRKVVRERKQEEYSRFLSNLESENYTEYFMRSRSFVLIDGYLNSSGEKYTVPDLRPKGILVGKIPPVSGNFFFKGIMDGHPEVLTMPYSDTNENLFWYCIRLARRDSSKILAEFWEMYDREACSREQYFTDVDRFETSLQRLLPIKNRYTSQELFVMFHIAYTEMLRGERVFDINRLVIYWEPHYVPRYDFSYLSMWLDDKYVNGQTIVLRRDNIVRTGSEWARTLESGFLAKFAYKNMFLDESGWGEEAEKDFKMRFEDIKLNPERYLGEVCKRMDIAWSDTMLKTTANGKSLSYRGSVDFDIKAVFNKYSDFLSEFDRFRVSIASSPYQKRYGYTYTNCLTFSRREIQEMFLKPFLFEENEVLAGDSESRLWFCKWMKWQLWNVRKHMVLDDVDPEFGEVEIK